MNNKTLTPWVPTPLLESRALSEAAGCRVFLKLDNLQPSGSFKSRGIGNYILQRLKSRQGLEKARTHFYAASGGNAGLACVHAAMMYGYPATVVVPSSAKPAMLEKLRAAGATAVIQYGSNIAESQAYIECVLLPQDPGGVFVPPFDHPDIWEGNATVMREIAEDLGGAPDVVACSVGGGGLLNGICKSLDERGWGEKVEVVATETAGADSLSQALLAGEVVTLPRITSAATSLGCVKVSHKTFEYAQRLNVSNLVLDDAEAMKGCCLLFEHEGLLTELTVGVNVPLCYDGLLQQVLGHRKILTSSSKVVIVVCGGSDISLEMLADWRGALMGPENVRGIAMDGIVHPEVKQIAASG